MAAAAAPGGQERSAWTRNMKGSVKSYTQRDFQNSDRPAMTT